MAQSRRPSLVSSRVSYLPKPLPPPLPHHPSLWGTRTRSLTHTSVSHLSIGVSDGDGRSRSCVGCIRLSPSRCQVHPPDRASAGARASGCRGATVVVDGGDVWPRRYAPPHVRNQHFGPRSPIATVSYAWPARWACNARSACTVELAARVRLSMSLAVHIWQNEV
jgi:hypothetical protein